MYRSILPARALRLTTGHKVRVTISVVLMFLTFALFVVGTWWFITNAPQISRDQEVWKNGVSADGSIEAKRTSKFGLYAVFANYEGKVTYTDAAGQPHQGSFDFWTVGGGPNTDAAAELRYDAKHPERFATNWSVEASGARWRATFILGAICVVLASVMIFALWKVIGEQRAFGRIARRGDEVALRVLAREPVQGRQGAWRYRFELGGPTPRTFSKELPSVFPCAQGFALALWIPDEPKHFLVMRSDLAPLALTAAEHSAAMARDARNS